MGKLLKPLIVVVLLLNIIALGLGVKTSSQRKTLKERTLKLEQSAALVAGKLNFKEFNAAQVKDLKVMETPLKQLVVKAESTYATLQETIKERDTTQQTLDGKNKDLDAAHVTLAATSNQVQELRTAMEAKDATATEKVAAAEKAVKEKGELEIKIAELNRTMQERDAKLATLEELYAKATNQVAIVAMGAAKTEEKEAAKSVMGKVVLVDAQWNFVILNIGRTQGISANAEMVVHRGEELVGKVRISNVSSDLSIADIIPDWQKQPMKEGDRVFVF